MTELERANPPRQPWWPGWISEASLARFVHRCYTHLTFVKCLLYAAVVYGIVWVTAVERLTNTSIRTKARVAATLVMPATRPAEATTRRWHELSPVVGEQGFVFHPTELVNGPADPAETERQFLAAAEDMSGAAEDDPAFLDALARFNFFADRLRRRCYRDEPWYARFVGEHEYQGCAVSVPSAAGPTMRASAASFLRYVDAFAETFPWTDASGAVDERMTKLVGPATAKSARSGALRAVPLSVSAAPWQLLAFRDANFAELCDGLPKATLFLLLALYFFAELRYRSVGPDGLFEQQAEPSVRTVRVLWGLILGLPVVIFCVEGRETPTELLRLFPMLAVIFLGAALIHCLDAMRRATVSTAFRERTLADKQRRLVPFAIGMACLVSGAVWGLTYSLLTLVLRFELGSTARGLLQTAVLVWMLWLVCVVLRHLLSPASAQSGADAGAPPVAEGGDDANGADDHASLWRELAKALALLLSPLAAHLLAWFTSV